MLLTFLTQDFLLFPSFSTVLSFSLPPFFPLHTLSLQYEIYVSQKETLKQLSYASYLLDLRLPTFSSFSSVFILSLSWLFLAHVHF